MQNWSWPTGAPADERRSLPLFTLMPNWKGGITETLSWLTDVMVSEQNVEQRRSVRRYPRRTFEAGFLRSNENRSRLDNFFTGVGRRLHLMPMWHEQFTLTGPGRTDGLVVFPAGSLAKREFRMGDLVLCTNGDPAHTFLLTVTMHDALTDSIVLQGVVASGPWPSGSRIIPLRVARNMEPGALANVADRVAQTQIRFTLTEPDTSFEGDWGYCSPLWRHKPNRAENVNTAFERKDYILDFETGVVDVTEVSQRTAINTSMRYIFFGRDEVYQVREFLYNARGRARRFYIPSFTADLFAAQNITTGRTFDVLPSGFLDFMDVPQEARRIISVEFNDGRPPIYRNITSVANIQNVTAPFDTRVERITVDQDMPPIVVGDIARISFVVPSRLDQDTIELFHHTDGLKAVSMAMVVRSSVVEGMPPIECWTTSLPYSVVEVERINSSAMITKARMYSVVEVERINSSATFTSGTIRQILKTYPYYGAEAMDSSAMAVSGFMRQILKSYSYYAPEAVNSSATMISGYMKAILIHYTSPADGLESSATITQGTLT